MSENNTLKAYHIKTREGNRIGGSSIGGRCDLIHATEGRFINSKIADWLYIPHYSNAPEGKRRDAIIGVIRQNILPFGLFGRLAYEMGTWEETKLLKYAYEITKGEKDLRYNRYSSFQIPKNEADILVNRIIREGGLLSYKGEIILLPRVSGKGFSDSSELINFLKRYGGI